MKFIAYIPLHYGKEYLYEAISVVEPHVDKIVVLYSKNPSFGRNGHLPNPDSEKELIDIAMSASSKIEWVNGGYGGEGEHRSKIDSFSRGYDLIMTFDADEVWKPEDIEPALRKAYDGNIKRYGIDGFVNFWRSFNKVCLDGFRPIRIIKPSGKEGQGEIKATIYHFGYAQSLEIMKYKWSIHGHQDELRKGWMEEIYLANRQTDNHPVAIGLWNTVDFDKNTLPEVLKQHPNFNKDLI